MTYGLLLPGFRGILGRLHGCCSKSSGRLEEFNGASLRGRFSFDLIIMRWATRYAWARELREWPEGKQRPAADPELFASHYLAVIFEEFTGKPPRRGKSSSTPFEQFAEHCFFTLGMPSGPSPKKGQVPWKTFRYARDEFMRGGIPEESAELGASFVAIRRDLWGDLSFFTNPADLTPAADDLGEAKDNKRRETSARGRTKRKEAKKTKTDVATASVLEWLDQEEDARADRPQLAFNRYVRNRQKAGAAVILSFDEWKPVYQRLTQ